MSSSSRQSSKQSSRHSVSVNTVMEEMISSNQIIELSEDSSLLYNHPPPKQRCIIKYQFRKISSKGALLVLLWVLLVNASTGSPNSEHQILSGLIVSRSQDPYTVLSYFLPLLVWLLTAILAGWLADTKLGNYKTTKMGLVLLFIASILNCVVSIVHAIVDIPGVHRHWYEIVITLPKCLMYMGNAMVVVTALQLGLEQMPDAFSTNITSFIAWFVLSAQFGIWIFVAMIRLPEVCLGAEFETVYQPIMFLLPVLYLGIALGTDFYFTPKLLQKEPVSLQFTFHLIYQVLKFAAKHKAPLNRSALTYWEENIPSRIDLGKSRYGGPFTTEQVENVKTSLMMLMVSIPVSIIVVSTFLFMYAIQYWSTTDMLLHTNSFNITPCVQDIIAVNVSGPYAWISIMMLIYEISIYPFVVKWVPSILKRIGIASVLSLGGNTVYLIFSIVVFYISDTADIELLWIQLPQSIVSALITILLYTGILEFVCAQAPQNFKGFILGYTWFLYSLSSFIAATIFSVLISACNEKICLIIFCSVAAGVSLLSVILYCISAGSYRRRVREETETAYNWVEGVYGRYFMSGSGPYNR